MASATSHLVTGPLNFLVFRHVQLMVRVVQTNDLAPLRGPHHGFPTVEINNRNDMPSIRIFQHLHARFDGLDTGIFTWDGNSHGNIGTIRFLQQGIMKSISTGIMCMDNAKVSGKVKG